MASEWREYRLGDIVDIYDGPHATPQKTESGPIFLGISNLVNGRLDLASVDRISEKDYLTWTRRVTPQEGDVVFSYETRLGEAAFIPSGLRCCLGRRMGLLRAKVEHLEPRFLLYAYLGTGFQETIRSRTVYGSTVNRIPLVDMPDFPIRLPSLRTQRAIAGFLGALDDKIEVNRRTNETLESIVRAIFKSWFVDFDPVRENVARKAGKETGQSPLPGLAAMMESAGAAPPDDVLDLFPDAFEDSELGPIPRGWKTGTFEKVATNHRRRVHAEDIEPKTPYIGLEHMPRRSIALSDWGTGEGLASNKREFKRGEILFGKLRPYFHKVGVAPVDGICSTDIVVVAPRHPHWFGFVLGHVSSDEFIQYTNATSTGTRMPRTRWTDMARYDVVLPPEQVASAFTELIQPLIDRIRNSIHESHTLAAARDTLLPKLILGKLPMGHVGKYSGVLSYG